MQAAARQTNVFGIEDTILIDGKIYVVERHFQPNRDLKSAIYAVVRNEAERRSDKK